MLPLHLIRRLSTTRGRNRKGMETRRTMVEQGRFLSFTFHLVHRGLHGNLSSLSILIAQRIKIEISTWNSPSKIRKTILSFKSFPVLSWSFIYFGDYPRRVSSISHSHNVPFLLTTGDDCLDQVEFIFICFINDHQHHHILLFYISFIFDIISLPLFCKLFPLFSLLFSKAPHSSPILT